ncbi:hypothetical protein L2E82_29117 [Cichorium intybus]|uniref:Uncharacterized protein n=1 Tax=Cichorium intybus TaxID=13427 RepID=A0ACB9CXB2_CICIN|nr:hypothetical protein L2E82_29117 [Cichorium intybus]
MYQFRSVSLCCLGFSPAPFRVFQMQNKDMTSSMITPVGETMKVGDATKDHTSWERPEDIDTFSCCCFFGFWFLCIKIDRNTPALAAGTDEMDTFSCCCFFGFYASKLTEIPLPLLLLLYGHSTLQVREMRDFAGEAIEVKKLVDANTKEASEKEKVSGTPSTEDSILEQIKKKPKLGVLDKTKKDWGSLRKKTGWMKSLKLIKKWKSVFG